MRCSHILLGLAATLLNVFAEKEEAAPQVTTSALKVPLATSLRGAALNTIAPQDVAAIITPEVAAAIIPPAEGQKSFDNLFTDQGNPAFIQYNGARYIQVKLCLPACLFLMSVPAILLSYSSPCV